MFKRFRHKIINDQVYLHLSIVLSKILSINNPTKLDYRRILLNHQ
ncbi:hypothetical protein A1OE_140 [Candidatus Endolissoclinum faulkneri L2]|uniref:Uncharacterized protein n=1 Tax=Candidatus Endolissoclinum faulkneri L2 TaxID=1193729 RepID=K7YP19_9PROT|nr:hypothetical protein A1OE_140 [Candidatus Endolissoclinum faulkneri L2]